MTTTLARCRGARVSADGDVAAGGGGDVDAGGGAERLAVGVAHARLQPVSAGAREHLVDAQHVPWVHADTQVEGVLAGVLHHVLVARNTGGLKRLGRDLLLLNRDKVSGERELIDAVLLLARIVDANLRICVVGNHRRRPRQSIRVDHRFRVIFTLESSASLAHARRHAPGTPRQYRDFGYGLFLITR